MPKWGLTRAQLASKPWGLPASVLRPAKTITNEIQGDVYVTELERMVVDSPPLQRLRRVRQLGSAHQVYPDGNHTRFSHVLGALRSSQDLLDAALGQENRPNPQPDLFQVWRKTLPADERNQKIAEAVVLTRLGALMHDMCHVPFGHTIEDDLGLLGAHDENGGRFEQFWSELDPAFLAVVGPALKEELRRLILSKADDLSESRYPFVEDLVGNTICADLMDYLPRDHQNLGLAFAVGHRFLEGLWVTPATHPHAPQRVAIEVERSGYERSDVISELLKYLRYRYEESERALFHPAKQAADAMIGKLLAMLKDAMWVDKAAELVGPLPEDSRRDVDELRRWLTHSYPSDQLEERLRARLGNGGAPLPSVHEYLDAQVQADLEEIFTLHGDDGLLERIFDESRGADKADTRRAAIATLSGDVLNRRLYKRIGRSLPQDAEFARKLWTRYGQETDARRRLEVEAASFIGLEERWHLVLWLPNPSMKLKLAEVLVGCGDWVTSLHDHSSRVRDIYESHQNLWAISVYAHPTLRDDDLRREALLAWLRERLGLRGWSEAAHHPSWTDIVIDHFASTSNLNVQEAEQLRAGAAASGARDTLSGFQDRLKDALVAMRATDEVD